MEIKLKPLRLLIKKYHRKPIPPCAWTPAFRLLFDKVKAGVTSSPCLARYDRSKLTFLKSDWSADGFGANLMQPDDSPASAAVIKRPVKDSIYDFVFTPKGALYVQSASTHANVQSKNVILTPLLAKPLVAVGAFPNTKRFYG